MTNQNKKLEKIERPTKSNWREQAIYRAQNRKWLGYSSKIALRMLSAIEDNAEMNQKQLALLANVTPQQISKIVKGKENLTLKTIAKFSEMLGVELISFPSYKYNSWNTQFFLNSDNGTVVVIQIMPQNSFFISNTNICTNLTEPQQFTLQYSAITNPLIINQ